MVPEIEQSSWQELGCRDPVRPPGALLPAKFAMVIAPASTQSAPQRDNDDEAAEMAARVAAGSGFWTDWLAELSRPGLLGRRSHRPGSCSASRSCSGSSSWTRRPGRGPRDRPAVEGPGGHRDRRHHDGARPRRRAGRRVRHPGGRRPAAAAGHRSTSAPRPSGGPAPRSAATTTARTPWPTSCRTASARAFSTSPIVASLHGPLDPLLHRRRPPPAPYRCSRT
jgi:hypothetical protein